MSASPPQPQTLAKAAALPPFTSYERFIVGVLAFLQFAVILDFMLMAPLGAMIMPALSIEPSQFGLIVSAYAFSAGASGLLMAGFADRFDRKRLLLVFYTGFILGTCWCGLANSFESLLAARIVTGLFGGVIGSIVMAISTDLFPPHMRGRVMGVIQTSFAASQVLGIPISLFLSSHWDWHVPFLALAGLGVAAGLVVAARMRPLTGHLALAESRSSPWAHLWATVAQPRHLLAFAATGLVTIGGFMLMPFSSAFIVGNVGIDLHSLPTVYFATGLSAIVAGPLIGRAADAIGKFRVFIVGTLLSMAMVLVYTHLPPVPLALLIGVNVVLFVGIFSRMIPFQAMVASVPSPAQRGAFNAISSFAAATGRRPGLGAGRAHRQPGAGGPAAALRCGGLRGRLHLDGGGHPGVAPEPQPGPPLRVGGAACQFAAPAAATTGSP